MGGCRKLTEVEIEAILAALEKTPRARRDRALFLLGVATGFRITELLSLRVSDVWHDGRLFDFVSVARRNMKKKIAGRTVPISDEAKIPLLLWLDVHPHREPGSPLFPGRANRPMSRKTSWAILHSAYRACGLAGKLGTHSMRKTFAGNVHEALGCDIFKTQKAMGHASPESTAAYLSVDESEIFDAIRNARKRPA